jgi:hypothetical protein
LQGRHSLWITRQSKTPEAGCSASPLAETYGIITPSSLHYERHHSGIPAIDPARHRLVIHGLVQCDAAPLSPQFRPLVP